MSTPLGGIGVTRTSRGFESPVTPAITPTATPATGRGEMPLVPLTSGSASGTIAPQPTPPAMQAGAAPSSQGGAAAAPSAASTSSSNGAGAAPTADASASDGANSTLGNLSGTDTFLQLLVAQMQNQDPTSPMDDQAFVTELAQFNTVEQMLSLKQTVASEVVLQQQSEGISLLGKNVTYSIPSTTGQSPTTGQGTVTGVSVDQGQVNLQVGSQQIPISEVTAVS